jgi:hypothetical protein
MIFKIQKPTYLMQIHMTPTKLKFVCDRHSFAFDDIFWFFFALIFREKSVCV